MKATRERLGLLRAAADGRIERDHSGYMRRSYPRVDQDVTAEVKAAIVDGHLSVPDLAPVLHATARVELTDAGRAWLDAHPEKGA
ncbi:hypothetical protein [Glutamicibacter sp. V16R2B1]|uniref:hypothetical protein n=1 Tax=Glutamicibacter sp. V16R2B1 TaxID=2036207 RepID=UPI0010FCE094|nr:hypothetical protein [Glutamicibacter sp. V16R2B1]MCK9901306.1 hypothetical protein [Frankia sp. Cpl3]TLK47995.1 hypothetical protein FDN03_15525 [Glutamicibacter sp. V16R2B1]